ncbi:hypothetical protein P3T86_05820 [Staphylococcus nepalensis]|uniref:hypothetical protein n=1 Tax=Staphylococcus nepalensis TaxID=214473 RepID=UPI002B25AA3D|nr:hypothetical protein [Staphylococcus nepalensis]WQL21276.1 hypothetical protein P3T86_05820 [Staphylococcus nepalensis]
MKISINGNEIEGNEEDVLKVINHIFSKENKKQPTFADRYHAANPGIRLTPLYKEG